MTRTLYGVPLTLWYELSDHDRMIARASYNDITASDADEYFAEFVTSPPRVLKHGPSPCFGGLVVSDRHIHHDLDPLCDPLRRHCGPTVPNSTGPPTELERH